MNNSRIITIPFFGTVSANSRTTLTSKRIDYPIRTLKVRASFPAGANRLVKLYYFISPDDETPTDKFPNGVNLFAELGENVYIVGDDNEVILDHMSEMLTGGNYLKVHAINEDTYDHTIETQMTLKMLQRKV